MERSFSGDTFNWIGLGLILLKRNIHVYTCLLISYIVIDGQKPIKLVTILNIIHDVDTYTGGKNLV